MSATAVSSAKPRAKRLLIAAADRESAQRALAQFDPAIWRADVALSGAQALEQVEREEYDLALLDRRFADLAADEVGATMRALRPRLRIVCRDSLEAAGPQEPAPARLLPPSSWALRSPARPAGQGAAGTAAPLPGMVGNSAPMAEVYRLTRLIAGRDTTVLLTGETGTGKELVALSIHRLGARAERPFVTVNCAAIPEPLLEAELFGHARGAFTGALQSRIGLIHSAHGGTLFLDEVGDLPAGIQAKLLRFLQSGEVQRLGSPDLFRVDVRVIAATNADLRQRLETLQFRLDLYYRLAVFPIHLPPLRTRPEDIPLLAQHWLEVLCRQADLPLKSIPPQTCRLLLNHHWPGNVRELQHAIERAFILADAGGSLLPDFFPDLTA